MVIKRFFSTVMAAGMLFGTLAIAVPDADAKNCWRDRNGRMHCDNGNHYGRYYDRRRNAWIDRRTGKILKGGLVGAGIGAGAGYLLDRPVGKSAVLGAGVGAGVQATRYSRFMGRHPVVKTAAYGALAGTAVNGMRRDASMGKGALWGAAIGTGVGALRHMD